ncbi:hypothetical protein VPH35_114546 [Triticum aestivum]
MSDGDCEIDCPDRGDCDCDCNCLCCCCCICDDDSWGDNHNGKSSGYNGRRRRHRCLKIILSLLFVAAAVAALVHVFAFAIVRPVRVAVEHASLTRLALAGPNGSALAYDVSLAVAAISAPLDAELLFAGERFAAITMMQGASPGYIRPGKTEVYNVAAAGESATPLGSTGVAEFVKESAASGMFRLELKLAGEVEYQTHNGAHKLEATCPLELPLPSSSAVPARFKKIKCVM